MSLQVPLNIGMALISSWPLNDNMQKIMPKGRQDVTWPAPADPILCFGFDKVGQVHELFRDIEALTKYVHVLWHFMVSLQCNYRNYNV